MVESTTKMRNKRVKSDASTPNEFNYELFTSFDNKFDPVIINPPWPYKLNKVQGENHYPTLTVEQLKKIPIRSVMSTDNILYLWTTNPFLDKAFELLKAWGLEYRTNGFTWIKTYKNGQPIKGMGYYTRNSGESLLCGEFGDGFSKYMLKEHMPEACSEVEARLLIAKTKSGKATKLIENHSVGDIIHTIDHGVLISETGKHSEKPMDKLLEKLRILYGSNWEKMNKLEVFCRDPKDGFTCFGNNIRTDDGTVVNGYYCRENTEIIENNCLMFPEDGTVVYEPENQL